METASFSPPIPTTSSDWVKMAAAPEGTAAGPEGGGASKALAAHTLGYQVSLTAFLVLELVLGFGSNLTVLVLYCSQSSLVDSVSNMVTVNLHVLDVLVSLLCPPLTLAVVLVPPGPQLALLCCFHEACVSFASIATAVNILVISLDRYDISVRPANRLLTPCRAALLLAAVWVAAVGVFFIPFLEAELTAAQVDPASLGSSAWRNGTLLCVGSGGGASAGHGVYYHLLLQVPIFFTTVAVMLFTYSRILRVLNIRVGSHVKRHQRLRGPSLRGHHGRLRKRKKKKKKAALVEEQCTVDGSTQCSHPSLVPSPIPTPSATSVPALCSPSDQVVAAAAAVAAAAPTPPSVGVGASVSAIVALRRAVRRHRDRRERQRRVLRMSLIIIATFLGCWAPLSVTNLLILGVGPAPALVSARFWFLAMAYVTTVSHPLLYAFTRQKLRRALRTKVKKRVVSLLQVDPSPGGTVIHNSWVENREACRQVRVVASKGADRCLAEAL